MTGLALYALPASSTHPTASRKRSSSTSASAFLLKGLEVDFVSSDNLLASAMLTEHIIRLGHKRIAHIAGRKGLWTAEQRKLGFRNTMMAAGIEIDETLP